MIKPGFSLFLVLFTFIGFSVSGQVQLSEGAPTATLNFSTTMTPTAGTSPATSFKGAGFSPDPTVTGRLNSNAWSVLGFDYGALPFGGTQTLDDFGRGSVNTAVLTTGIYAYTDAPASVNNPTMLIQPGENDFSPGHIILRIRNNGATSITQLEVSYNIFVRNDENRSNAMTFSHSPDNTVFEPEATLDYASPDVADAFAWSQVGNTPSRNIIITGINILPGQFYYLRWSFEDISGTGDRDEFGLDDIVVTGMFGPPAPEINVKGLSPTGTTILTGDTNPTTAKGSLYDTPISITGGYAVKFFYIQNLGGAPLNVSNITLTGAQAGSFTINNMSTATGSIAAADGSVSNREVSITFHPTFEGIHTAQVNVFSNDSNENPYTFWIRGTGFVPKPDINVRGITGGTGNINSTSTLVNVNNNTLWDTPQIVGTGNIKDYRIVNGGNPGAPLLLTGNPIIAIIGDNPEDFIVTTQPSSSSLNAGGFTNFYISFTPTASGIRTATVSIANNDSVVDVYGNSESPFTFKVQGTGVAPEADLFGNNQPIVSGSLVTSAINHTFFDYLNVSGSTITRTFTLRNTGNASLTVGTPVISGVNASDFTLLTNPAGSVAAGGNTTFSIQFDPSATGVRNATVSFATNDFNENPYTFAIQGYGIDYTPCNFLAVETLGTQDFEATPATPTLNYTTASSVVTGGAGFAATADSGNSPRFIGARSLQVNNGNSVTTFAAVNTTGYQDVQFSCRLASLATTATEGSDSTDRVIISISPNNGATWSDEIEITGNSASKWSFTSGTGIVALAYDGNNVATSLASGAGYVTSDGYSTIQLSNLPAVAALLIRVTMINNNAGEIWALDNVSVFARKEESTQWNGSAWSNGIPTSSVKAIIVGNYNTASGNIQSCKLEVRAGATLTVNSGQSVTAESDLNNLGTIVIENGGSLIQKNDYATNTGSIIVRRNTTPMRKFDYTYWSSPVAGQTLYNLSPQTLSDKFFQFNTTGNQWQAVPSSTVMVAGKGYIIRAPQTFSTTVPAVYNGQFSGVPNNGFITQPVYNATGTWNLLGNPYASALDADRFLQYPGNNILNGTLYFWTHNTPITNNVYTTNDYASYNLLGGAGTAAAIASGVNTTIPTRYIASGQGFFAVATSAGTVTFNNGMRVAGSNLAFFRQINPVASGDSVGEKHRLWLNLNGPDGLFRQILVGYAADATNDFDRNFDGVLLTSNANISFYSKLADQQLVIEGHGLPFDMNDRFLLGYSSTIAGSFNIAMENLDGLFAGQEVFLKDNLLGIFHDIKSAPYVFETEIGEFKDRFEIVYQSTALSVNDPAKATGFDLAVSDGTIKVRSRNVNLQQVEIFDTLGRSLYKKSRLDRDEVIISDFQSANQTLMVRITLSDGKQLTRKILW